jgi:hypothetical protein
MSKNMNRESLKETVLLSITVFGVVSVCPLLTNSICMSNWDRVMNEAKKMEQLQEIKQEYFGDRKLSSEEQRILYFILHERNKNKTNSNR